MAKDIKNNSPEETPAVNTEAANELFVAGAEEVKTDEVPEGMLKIKVLLPLAGKFLLPQNPGAEMELSAAEAMAIVDAGYAEILNPES